ncbi:hypothetical protein ACRQ5D_16390 [Mucilaginibacter sp. P25]|uniref:hypothetical protein n=1 Tax=Mucilaginibacter sp. P25 TaxID=3423945 RepID=UPI003D7B0FCA
MKKLNRTGAMLIALLSLSGTLKAQEQQAAKAVASPEAQAKADAEVEKSYGLGCLIIAY